MTTHTAPRPATRPVRGQIDPTPRAGHPEWFAPLAQATPGVQAPVRAPAVRTMSQPRGQLTPSASRARRVSAAQLRVRRTVAVLVLATVALLVVFVLGRASVHAAQSGTDTTSATPVVVTVQAGDTLWTIATRIAPKADPRATIRAIRELNGLSTGAVQAGQRLVLPH